MKCAVDTNVLLRIFVGDDPVQQEIALASVKEAELVAISIHTLCEFVWVLMRGYKKSPAETAKAVRQLTEMPNTAVDRAMVEAGLSLLYKGGDFADGVIAFDGRRLGGQTFLTFDKDAADLLNAAGVDTRLLNR